MKRQYEMIEFSYDLSKQLNNSSDSSDVSIDLTGTFICEDERIEVKGFYAGNKIYKVRFLPTKVGTYTYEMNGIITETGLINVEAATANHHGILRAEGIHVKFMDGTYFCPFGTTVYGLAHQTEELMSETLETLEKAPFNKIRMCVFPKHYQYNCNEPTYYPFQKKDGKWDVDHPDFRFWEAFEDKLLKLDKLGIVVDLILFHPYDRWGFSKMGKESDLIYLDYLLRRFSAYPNLMWSMANEYDLFEDKQTDDWYQIEEYIAAHDPYHHMLSNHNCFAPYDYNRKNITHVSIQIREPSRVVSLQKKYGKPVFYDECAYEGNLEENFGSMTGEEMTEKFWKITVTGGYCTHGETYIDYDQENIQDAVVFWAKGGRLVGTSPKRIAFLRSLMESLPGPIEAVTEDMSPTQMFRSSNKEIKNAINAALTKMPEDYGNFVKHIADMDDEERLYHMVTETEYCGHVGEQVFITYYGRDQHSRITLHLPKDKKYQVEWIDTWNMTREIIGTEQTGTCQFRLPEKQWMAVMATQTD